MCLVCGKTTCSEITADCESRVFNKLLFSNTAEYSDSPPSTKLFVANNLFRRDPSHFVWTLIQRQRPLAELPRFGSYRELFDLEVEQVVPLVNLFTLLCPLITESPRHIKAAVIAKAEYQLSCVSELSGQLRSWVNCRGAPVRRDSA